MAVDRGSLRYRIELEAEGALRGLRDFRTGLIQARQSWRAFKRDLRSIDTDARSAATGVGRLTDAAKKSAEQAREQERATRRRNDQSRETVRQTKKDEDATERLAKATRRLAFERRKIRQLKRAIGAAQISASSAEIKRLETSLGLLQKLHRAELELIEARRTAGTGRDIRTAATFEQAQELELLKAKNRLERAHSVDSEFQLQNARAELEVKRKQLRVTQQELEAEKLRGRGALPSGRTVDQAAQQALDREKDTLAVKTRQGELERQQTEEQQTQTREAKARNAVERNQAAQQIRRIRERMFQERELLTTGLSAEETADRLRRKERESLKVKEAQSRQEATQTVEQKTQLRTREAQLAVERATLRAHRKRLELEGLRATGRTARGLTVEETAREAFERDLERLRVQQLRRQLEGASPEFRNLRAQLLGTGREATTAGSRLRAFGNVLDQVGGKGNRISFTFRRLIGILAAFAAARAVVRVFREGVAEQIRFSAQLEQSQLGVASLITAVSTVRTALGDAADAGDRLALAEGLARRQIALLRRDALETVATFKELADAFQTAVAPGVQAGLNLDQIREFTVRISQAAAAIGLPANQLAEEIRSLLQGTIQLRTTRIAAALGITNEDIRRAKELGILVEFLNERFEAFATAGTRALSLFNAVVARLRDAFSEMLRAGGVEFFEELKSLLSEFLDLLLKTTKEGIEVNPQALEVVRGIFSGLQRAVVEARRLRDSLSFGDAISLGEGLGNTLGTIAETLGAIIEGFLLGVRDLIRLVRPIGQFFKNLFPEKSGKEFLTTVVRILTALGGLTLLLSTALSLAGFLVLPFVRLLATLFKVGTALGLAVGSLVKIPTIVAKIGALSSLILSPWVLVAAAVATALFFLGKFAIEAANIELKFETIIRLIRIGLVSAFRFAAASIKISWTLLTNALTTLLDSVVTGFKVGLRGAVEGAVRLANLLPFVSLEETIAKLKAAREEDDADFDRRLEERKAKVAAALAEMQASLDKIKLDIAFGATKAIRDDETARTFKELFAGLKDEIAAALSGFADPLMDGLEDSEEAAKGLVERLRDLPGVVGRGTKQVEGLEDALKSILQEFERAQESLQVTIRAEGTADFTRDLITQEVEREFRIRRETLSITQEIEALELTRAGIQARLLDLTEKTNKQSQVAAAGIRQAVETGQDLLRTQQDIREAEKRRAVLIAQENALRKQGRNDAAEAVALDARAQEERIAGLKEALALSEDFAGFLSDALVQIGGEELLDIVERLVQATGEDKSIAEDITELEKLRIDLEQKINELIRTRVEDLARRQLEQSRERLRIAEAELRGQRDLARFSSVLQERAPELGLAEARAALDVENARLKNLTESFTAQQRLLQVNREILATSRQRGETDEEILKTIEAQTAAQRELGIEVSKQDILTRAAILRFQEEQRKLAEPFSFGLEAGLADFVNNSRNQFEAWRRIATSAVEGFSATAAGLLTAALDPTQDVNALEAFGQLFLDIFNQVIQNLIQQGLAQILVGLVPINTGGATLLIAAQSLMPAAVVLQGAASTLLTAAIILQGAGGGAGAASGGAVGGHEGGPIPRFGLPSTAHRRARGAALGSRILPGSTPRRPSWVHPRDTVPLWGEPGEWVIRTRAVRKYGEAFMAAVNEGRIPSAAARAMADVSRFSPTRRAPSVPSFQEGGSLPARALALDTGARGATIIQPVLVADEKTWRRLQAAGPKAQTKWLRDNATEQQLALSRR